MSQAVRRRVALVVLACLAPATQIPAALVPLDLPALATRSECIVQGEVIALSSYWGRIDDESAPVLFTRVTLRVAACWKDSLPRAKASEGPSPSERDPETSAGTVKRASDGSIEEITLEYLGGQIGERRQLCLESPVFEKGETALVFLRRRGESLWTTGWQQGKYRVLLSRVRPRGEAARWVPTHVEGSERLPISDTVALEALEIRVRKILEADARARATDTAPGADGSGTTETRPAEPRGDRR